MVLDAFYLRFLTITLGITLVYLRPLKNVQFCSSSRKAKILTTLRNRLRIPQGGHRNWAKGAFCKGLYLAYR